MLNKSSDVSNIADHVKKHVMRGEGFELIKKSKQISEILGKTMKRISTITLSILLISSRQVSWMYIQEIELFYVL